MQMLRALQGQERLRSSMVATLHMPMLEDEACISLIDRFRTLHSGTPPHETNQYRTTPYDMDIVHTKHESMMQTL